MVRRGARSGRRKPARTSLVLKLVLLLAVIGAGGLAYGLHEARTWRPDEALWPDQGALVGAGDGAIDFETLKGLGASFVYIEASAGGGDKDARFSQNLANARAAGLQVGAVHDFDPCLEADPQSANFLTMVPREADLLPPAIRMVRNTGGCAQPVRDAAVQSELITLVNQIEMHAGSPVILAPSEAFEVRYGITGRIERALWLERNWIEPEYGARPWRMWTANADYATQAADEPLRWLVVRP